MYNVQCTCLNNWNRQIYLLFLPCVLFSLFFSWNTKNHIVDSLLKLNTFHPFCCFLKRLSGRSIQHYFFQTFMQSRICNKLFNVVFLFDQFSIIVYTLMYMYLGMYKNIILNLSIKFILFSWSRKPITMI